MADRGLEPTASAASPPGASASIGHRGALVHRRAARPAVTVGLPGTGIYWTESYPPAAAPHGGHRLAFVVLALAVVAITWALS